MNSNLIQSHSTNIICSNHKSDCVPGTKNKTLDEKNGLRAVTGEGKKQNKTIKKLQINCKLLLREKVSACLWGTQQSGPNRFQKEGKVLRNK